MLWTDEQRGIGELMTEQRPGASSIVRGHAAFHRDYKEVFRPWMHRFAHDLFSEDALGRERLQLLQWALYGLVRQLDEEGAYRSGWIGNSADEIHEQQLQGSADKYWEQLKKHLVEIESR